MEHYICVGSCHGLSETPGTCQATDCDRYEKSLVDCNCEDGNHAFRMEEEQLEEEIEEAAGE